MVRERGSINLRASSGKRPKWDYALLGRGVTIGHLSQLRAGLSGDGVLHIMISNSNIYLSSRIRSEPNPVY